VSAGEERSPAEIQADIERTREELGDTVEALAAKTDVKARAQERVEEIKQDVKAKVTQATPSSAQDGGQQLVAKVRANPVPFAAGAALLVAFLIGRRSARP
jgi:hypothetical protein